MEKVPSEFDLSGKVAIVTGGGRDMGYHIALAFLVTGHVFLIDGGWTAH